MPIMHCMIPINAPVNVRPWGGGGLDRQSSPDGQELDKRWAPKGRGIQHILYSCMMSRRAVGAQGWGITQPYVVLEGGGVDTGK